MLKRDRKAIQESIEHWEEIRSLFAILAPETKNLNNLRGVHPVVIFSDYPENKEILEKISGYGLESFWGGRFCPLCAMYNNDKTYAHCRECPLAKAGLGCNDVGSPWSDFNNHPTLENCERMLTTLRNLINEGGDND